MSFCSFSRLFCFFYVFNFFVYSFHVMIFSRPSGPDVPNLSLTITYPFIIPRDEHAALKFLMTKKLSEILKSTEVST